MQQSGCLSALASCFFHNWFGTIQYSSSWNSQLLLRLIMKINESVITQLKFLLLSFQAEMYRVKKAFEKAKTIVFGSYQDPRRIVWS